MPEKLKDTLIPQVQVLKLGEAISSVYPEFKPDDFICLVFDSDWANRELKQKMRHITVCLKQTLPDNYDAAIRIPEQIAPRFRGFIALPFSNDSGKTQTVRLELQSAHSFPKITLS